MSERFVIARTGCDLAGERWPGNAQLVVLLHEGVSDRRGWRHVAGHLAPLVTAVAYDRRGYGESAVSTAPFTHVDDLLAVLDREQAGRAWLVGASAGGGLALDTALLAPDRVAGLVLIGTAVSGAPEPELDPHTQRFDVLLDAAIAAGNLDEVNRLETWLWLDGPAGHEGRVGGEARALALDMNAIILRNRARENEGGSGVDTWRRLDEVQVPVTVALRRAADQPACTGQSPPASQRSSPTPSHRDADGGQGDTRNHARGDVRSVYGQQAAHQWGRPQPGPQGAFARIRHRHLRCCRSHAGPTACLTC